MNSSNHAFSFSTITHTARVSFIPTGCVVLLMAPMLSAFMIFCSGIVVYAFGM